MTGYTWRDVRDNLESLPTLCVTQADDLKIDLDDVRVYLSRVGEYPETEGVSVEHRFNGDGRWRETDDYSPDEIMEWVSEELTYQNAEV